MFIIIELSSRIGTATFGEIKRVMSGTARIENPNPVNPCNMAEMMNIKVPIIIRLISISIPKPIL